MPFVQVHLAAGRSDEQKRALLLAISAAVHSSIGAPVDSVRVWINEFPREELSPAGESQLTSIIRPMAAGDVLRDEPREVGR